MVYGGSKYKAEISATSKYNGLLVELKNKNKFYILNDTDVDELSITIKAAEPDNAFNDEHLVSMVILSGSNAVCTEDRNAEPFLKKPDFYSNTNRSRPRILKETTPLTSTRNILANA